MISISSFAHKAVMLDEVLNVLLVKPGGRYIDCTLGVVGTVMPSWMRVVRMVFLSE